MSAYIYAQCSRYFKRLIDDRAKLKRGNWNNPSEKLSKTVIFLETFLGQRDFILRLQYQKTSFSLPEKVLQWRLEGIGKEWIAKGNGIAAKWPR